MSELPPFDDDGLLPGGDYELTLEELRRSRLVTGAGVASVSWDNSWRSRLVDGLEVMSRELWQVGIRDIFVDGSFAEDKDHPNDVDGYFVCEREHLLSGRLERELNLLDPKKCWTWDPESRRPYRGYPKLQLPMWHAYRVELYPHWVGLSSGIVDEFGNELEFPAAFRRSRRDGRRRGIVKLREEAGGR